MDGELQLPEPAAAEALANFEAFLDATPELGVVLAQDKGDTLLRAMKKHFAAKWADGRQAAGVSFFMALVRRSAHIPRVALEQPVSIISSLYRKPDQVIQPWQFGHGETKATCLWLRGLPLLQPTAIVEGREARVHRMAPGPDRARDRSATYQGIADAMAAQWGCSHEAHR